MKLKHAKRIPYPVLADPIFLVRNAVSPSISASAHSRWFRSRIAVRTRKTATLRVVTWPLTQISPCTPCMTATAATRAHRESPFRLNPASCVDHKIRIAKLASDGLEPHSGGEETGAEQVSRPAVRQSRRAATWGRRGALSNQARRAYAVVADGGGGQRGPARRGRRS